MIIRGIENFPEEARNAVVGLGNFDGVHIGHQELIKTCIAKAKELGVKSGVVTFDPHPVQFFDAKGDFKTLMTLEQKVEALLKLGLDFVLVLPFDGVLSSFHADEFIDRILINRMSVCHVMTGYNFSFGAKRSGNSITLDKRSKAGDFGYTQIRQVMYESLEVSTTYLKDLLKVGRVKLFSELCLRYFTLSGVVEKGQGMAKSVIGMATANISINQDEVLPKFGVYLVRVQVEGVDQKLWGVANIGKRPTVDSTDKVTFEVHLMDFNQDIYGSKLMVEFITFTRPERKYQSLEDLKYAIHIDARNAHYLVRNIDSLNLITV